MPEVLRITRCADSCLEIRIFVPTFGLSWGWGKKSSSPPMMARFPWSNPLPPLTSHSQLFRAQAPHLNLTMLGQLQVAFPNKNTFGLNLGKRVPQQSNLLETCVHQASQTWHVHTALLIFCPYKPAPVTGLPHLNTHPLHSYSSLDSS